ncbi:uncharacterized protein LOC132544966 [Ylistrum balloti]|uniref:uncharacterized protein LOC132544966 n=1 Tax=Ylistrum balloti TaxID=509963 RepID=UPI002905EA0D|nr:uncharacterized protein LOC132544966 [Ylistrum balloti]
MSLFLRKRQREWDLWQSSLAQLDKFHVSRQYFIDRSCDPTDCVHIYTDASKEAIAAVAYFCTTNEEGVASFSLFLGKSKDTDSLGISANNVEDEQISKHLLNNGTVWHFNPPHTSDMGGSWERMIGSARRILDSVLLDVKGKGLTREILTTLMAEVTAIINSRPLVEVSSDPQDPHVLSPGELLTQKPQSAQLSPFTLDIKDAYRKWKMVQFLTDQFWKKWKTDHLQGLQGRRKWVASHPNLKQGDVVLLKKFRCTSYGMTDGQSLKSIPSRRWSR